MKPTSFNSVIKRLDMFFAPFIRFFSRYGVTANHISFSQLPFLALFVIALIYGKIFGAVASLFIVLSIDTLDGSWARITKTATWRGERYDKFFDLLGIYTFLAGSLIVFSQLFYLNAMLGACVAFIYLSNRYAEPELYCGVRAFGCLGLFLELFLEGALYVSLSVSLLLGIVILLYKVARIRYVKS